jgi:hypothetical protein
MKRMPHTAPALVALALAIGGCGRRATLAECDALLERYVELLIRQEDPGARESEIAQAKSAAHAKAAVNPAFLRCTREVRQKDALCALAAPNVDELEKCME